jgi:hypothetical protein
MLPQEGSYPSVKKNRDEWNLQWIHVQLKAGNVYPWRCAVNLS